MNPIKYRKRPVTIEAAQLTGDTAQWHAIYLWIEANTLGSFEPLAVIEGLKPYPASGVSIDPRDGRLIISTLEGLHWADEGDWIIRGVAGEFYPCKDAIFKETYEPATERMGTDRPGVENADTSGTSAEPSEAEIQAAARALDPEAWETDLSEERGADRYMIRGRRGQTVTRARAALVAARKAAGR